MIPDTRRPSHSAFLALISALLLFIATLGDAISDVTITCNRNATTATATVTGATLSLVPGWAPTVTQTVAVAVERIS